MFNSDTCLWLNEAWTFVIQTETYIHTYKLLRDKKLIRLTLFTVNIGVVEYSLSVQSLRCVSDCCLDLYITWKKTFFYYYHSSSSSEKLSLSLSLQGLSPHSHMTILQIAYGCNLHMSPVLSVVAVPTLASTCNTSKVTFIHWR